jgi:hypothetical protein
MIELNFLPLKFVNTTDFALLRFDYVADFDNLMRKLGQNTLKIIQRLHCTSCNNGQATGIDDIRQFFRIEAV